MAKITATEAQFTTIDEESSSSRQSISGCRRGKWIVNCGGNKRGKRRRRRRTGGINDAVSPSEVQFVDRLQKVHPSLVPPRRRIATH